MWVLYLYVIFIFHCLYKTCHPGEYNISLITPFAHIIFLYSFFFSINLYKTLLFNRYTREYYTFFALTCKEKNIIRSLSLTYMVFFFVIKGNKRLAPVFFCTQCVSSIYFFLWITCKWTKFFFIILLCLCSHLTVQETRASSDLAGQEMNYMCGEWMGRGWMDVMCSAKCKDDTFVSCAQKNYANSPFWVYEFVYISVP